ncbi:MULTISPECIES: hypothetical protein [unclassified Nonomuraea]|uniref:hypothetical protein n=1 Tax=unclassified Nonomuraea TaxID=2593643 RepID=UPI0033F715BA
MTDDELRDELLRRTRVDREARDPGHVSDPGWADRCAAVDEDNTVWLMSVVSSQGWPLISQVGEDAARAACLLAQHADAAPELQRHFRAAMADAADRGEALPGHLAGLEDRVRANRRL